MRAFLGRNWFVISLLVGVVMAIALRDSIAGADAGGLLRGMLRNHAVIVIFVLIGLTLPTERIVPSLARVKVHVFIQTVIFVAIPIAIALMVAVVRGPFLSDAVVAGLYAVAVLPTTGSSCIVFTQAAGGNVVIAAANSTIANIIGIFLSPILLSLLLGTQGRAMSASHSLAVMQGLALLVFLPLVFGQIVRGFARVRIMDNENWLRGGSSALISVVVFLSASSALDAGFGDLLSSEMAARVGFAWGLSPLVIAFTLRSREGVGLCI
jgi:sodium/bile acid cotransporter 7